MLNFKTEFWDLKFYFYFWNFLWICNHLKIHVQDNNNKTESQQNCGFPMSLKRALAVMCSKPRKTRGSVVYDKVGCLKTTDAKGLKEKKERQKQNKTQYTHTHTHAQWNNL